MTVLAAIAALAVTGCVGYYFGRRAGSAPSTWKKRTSRIQLCRMAINLLALLTARRIRRSLPAERVFAEALRTRRARYTAPLGILRS
jgi:hypothetical protein